MLYIQPPYACPICHYNDFDLAPNLITASTVQFVQPDLLTGVIRRITRQPLYDSAQGDEHIIDGYICKNCGFVSLYSRTMRDSLYSSEA